MKTLSFRFFRLLSLVFLLVLFVGCNPGPIDVPTPGPSPIPVNILAPAETPILETILDIDHHLIVPYHAAGMFTMSPGRSMELRLRVPWPTTLQIEIEGKALTEVTDNADHPGLDGYYRISEIRPIDDIRMFWRVLVVLPQDKQGNVDFAMTVHDKSGETDRALQILVFRSPVTVPRPSEVFFNSGNNRNPDQKQWKGPDTYDYGNGFIVDHVTLAGWLLEAPSTLDNGQEKDNSIEDIHYSLWLDNDFIVRNYSSNTLPLAGATMPGTWYTWGDDKLPGRGRVQMPLIYKETQPNAATFLMPGTGEMTVELNAWHRDRHNNQVPSGWNLEPFPAGTPQPRPEVYWPFNPKDPEVYWPFNPKDPEGTRTPLAKDNYVIITGTLVEDSGHLHQGDDTDGGGCDGTNWTLDTCENTVPYPTQVFWKNRCWQKAVPGHGGWLEIHPMDSIRRVDGPRLVVKNPKTGTDEQVPLRKYPVVVQVCDRGDGTTPSFDQTDIGPDKILRSLTSHDDINLADIPNAVIAYTEVIDQRFTDQSTIESHSVEPNPCDPTKLRVRTQLKDNTQGHFMGVYMVWWTISDQPRPSPANCVPPSTPTTPEESPPTRDPVCTNKPYLPQCK